MMRLWRGFVVLAALGLAAGCGGKGKSDVEEPVTDDPVEEEEPTSEDELVPQEKYEEIRRLFDRKTTVIGRCFVEALDAGEINKRDKVLVTVSTTITEAGAPTNTRIIKASTESSAMKSCVVRYVSSWEFPTLPQPVEFSHVYKFEEF